MSKNNESKTSDKGAKSKAPAPVFVAKGAAEDALSGRIGARTHSIHSVLLDAALVGALLTTKQITERATAHLGAPCNATASHLNTMKGREYLEREQGAWRLTDDALALCGAKWAQDAKAPAKKAPKKK